MPYQWHRYETKQGSKIAVYCTGTQGPSIFAVSGLQGVSMLDTPLAGALEAAANFGARVTMMDITGAGNSTYTGKLTMERTLTDVAEVYLRYVGDPAIWVGASMGAWAMLLFHRGNPGWFRSMCALAPAIDWDKDYLIPGRQAGIFREVPGGVELHNLVMPIDMLESMAAFRLGNAPFPLRCPLHMILGAKDPVASVDVTKAFAARLGPSCTVEVLPDDAHEVAKVGSNPSLFAFGRWLRTAVDRAATTSR